MLRNRYLRKAALRVEDHREYRAIRARLRSPDLELVQPYLETVLRRAAEEVPYYRQFLSQSRGTLAQFGTLPPLTKTIIRDHFEDLKSTRLVSGAWYLNSSGGSTGQPITLLQDREYARWSNATTEFYYRAFLGVEPRAARKVILWGSERDLFQRRRSVRARLTDWTERATFLNSFRMTTADMRSYVDRINQVRPVFIRGYAGSLYQMAQFVERQGLRVHRPRFVYSAAETLRPFMRETIERVFGCKVHDYYGSREIGAIAGECREGRMHVFGFNTLLEVVDERNRPVAAGQEGRVLVTTLHNHSMPLLRYEIGDTAVVGGPCPCGSPLPTLTRITGRVTDHFVTRAGSVIHGEYFTHLFYFREWVEEFQVLQVDLGQIRIYYAPRGVPRQEEVAEIEAKIRLVMGEECRVEWERVDEVPRTPQGKLLFTRSLVAA